MRGQAVKDAPAGKTIKITGTIQAASASGNNGELEITKDLTIKPNGSSATLDANNMSRIFKVTGGKFQLWNNMVLQNGNAGENEGGGIYVSGGELVLSETTIKNCIAQDGGGIFLTGNGATGTMSDGKVSFNLATDTSEAKGGGIYIQESASFTMQSGNINSNKVATGTVEDGGGVYVCGQGRGSGTHASFTLNGGTIKDNAAGFGGGVMADAGGSCTMTNNGIISENRANYGGGVCAKNADYTDGVFTMQNGTITGNRAYQNGGAAEVYGVFTWEGGSITGNHVNNGPDIIHRDGGHFNNPHNYTAS